MGTIYRRKFKDKNGNTQEGKTFWIRYQHNGQPVYESAKSSKWAEAAKLLKRREGEIANGKLPGNTFDKVMFAELVEGIKEDYKLKGQDRPRTAHLESYFEGIRAVEVTTNKIKAYINHRFEEGAANATVKLELAALKRMLNLGAQETPPKVDRVPHIPNIEVHNTKRGYFEDSDYYAIVEHLPDYMKGPVMFAYWTGWRNGQIRALTWAMVNIDERLITAPGEITKNKKDHTIYVNDPLMEIIKERRSKRNLGCPYVFHRDGQQIRDFRFIWNEACRDAGLGYGYKIHDKYIEKWKHLGAGPTFHDFRRTAVRNLIRSGVTEKVAMKITGHKTRSVFDRYNIVTPDDLKQAAEKQAEKLVCDKFCDKRAENEISGAGGRNRTDMELPPRDFESRASTSFTTPASFARKSSLNQCFGNRVF
jgi:integrase